MNVTELLEQLSKERADNFFLRERIKKLEGGETMNQQSPTMQWNAHDVRVILFQVVVAGVQALLLGLMHFNYGPYTPDVVLGIQVVAEAIRRLVIS